MLDRRPRLTSVTRDGVHAVPPAWRVSSGTAPFRWAGSLGHSGRRAGTPKCAQNVTFSHRMPALHDVRPSAADGTRTFTFSFFLLSVSGASVLPRMRRWLLDVGKGPAARSVGASPRQRRRSQPVLIVSQRTCSLISAPSPSGLWACTFCYDESWGHWARKPVTANPLVPCLLRHCMLRPPLLLRRCQSPRQISCQSRRQSRRYHCGTRSDAEAVKLP
jgi:hypothetical protein